MNDIFILVSHANNGIGHAIVAVPDGSNPWRWLQQYFVWAGHQRPDLAVKDYTIVDRITDCTTHEGVIDVLEYYGGDAHYGRKVVTKYDFNK